MPTSGFEVMVIHADQQGDINMLVFGIDAHKRTHTIVAIDERATPGQATGDQRHQRRPSDVGGLGWPAR
jgi:hypothetical protein